jgi:hypothetical protein
VQSGILAPDGPAFRALIIDGDSSLPYDVVSKLEDYAKGNLPIIFLKSVPANVSGACLLPKCDLQLFQTRLNRLTSKYPTTVKIRSSLDTLPQALSTLMVKSRVLFTDGSWFHTIWKGNVDSFADYIYFQNPNPSAKAVFSVEFSETRYPYEVDTWTGTYSPVVEYKRVGSTISMAMNLNGNATRIIAFAKDKSLHGQRASSLSVTDSSKNIIGFRSKDGGIIAQAVGNGSVTLSNGTVAHIQANVPAASTLKTWNITIEDWRPTSDISSTQTEVTNHTLLNNELKPWVNYNLSNVSGIGHYTTVFSLASLNAKLSLGTIQHTVKGFLNDHELPPINLFNPVIDISAYSQIGINKLQIDVSTTLFNAVKSRSSTIMTAGVPASLANPLLAENSTSAEYGLLGPVVVTPFENVKIA